MRYSRDFFKKGGVLLVAVAHFGGCGIFTCGTMRFKTTAVGYVRYSNNSLVSYRIPMGSPPSTTYTPLEHARKEAGRPVTCGMPLCRDCRGIRAKKDPLIAEGIHGGIPHQDECKPRAPLSNHCGAMHM